MKKQLGQFFTTSRDVKQVMASLVKNDGSFLEPSCGSGELLLLGKDRDHEGWELDEKIIPIDPELNITYGDFFKLSKTAKKYATILGNPPFVAWKDVLESTRLAAEFVNKNYGGKSNLYYLFIDRCVDLLEDDGELVFIVPKEWVYMTTARYLRDKLSNTGAITDYVDLGETKVFTDADVPALVIFRFQKGAPQGLVRYQSYADALAGKDPELRELTSGSLWMLSKPGENNSGETLGKYFDVNVGLVTGADKVFNVTKHPLLEDFKREGTTVSMMTSRGVEEFLFLEDYGSLAEIPPVTKEYIEGHREALLARRIRSFDETNYWKYGAIRNISKMTLKNKRTDLIYCYAKTRNKPFFHGVADVAVGSLLVLTPKQPIKNVEAVVEYLNSASFWKSCEELGLTTGNKVSFQPSTLREVPVVEFFEVEERLPGVRVQPDNNTKYSPPPST